MKICNKCNRELDESCFSKKKTSKDGLSTICKDCKREYDKEYDRRLKKKKLEQTQDVGDISKGIKTLVCEKCGKDFTVGKKSDGINFIVRKYCLNCSSSVQQTKTRQCKICGTDFSVNRTPDGRHFQNIWLCEECRKPKETKTIICERCGKPFTVTKYPGTDSFKKIKYCSPECTWSVPIKYSICECCGKEFRLKRTNEGHFIPNQYCSEECRLKVQRAKLDAQKDERLTKIRNTCQKKYGVDYPCQTQNCVASNPNIVSSVNIKFASRLDKEGIDYQHEFILDSYSYDFLIKNTNILVEINPTFTHTTLNTGIFPAKDKMYHYNKSTTAKEHGYICLCIWDWVNWQIIIDMIKNYPNILMRYRGVNQYFCKGSLYVERIDRNLTNTEEQLFIDKGYLPIFDDGYDIIIL